MKSNTKFMAERMRVMKNRFRDPKTRIFGGAFALKEAS
jgi:hypothetical protein